jgi:hypothetical protein
MTLDIIFGVILFYKKSVDGIIRRCAPEFEQQTIIKDCHDSPCLLRYG